MTGQIAARIERDVRARIVVGTATESEGARAPERGQPRSANGARCASVSARSFVRASACATACARASSSFVNIKATFRSRSRPGHAHHTRLCHSTSLRSSSPPHASASISALASLWAFVCTCRSGPDPSHALAQGHFLRFPIPIAYLRGFKLASNST